MKKVVIVGGGFSGLKAAKRLGRRHEDLDVLLLDRRNYHLFQPLLCILASFDESLSKSAARDLESLGVEILTDTKVTETSPRGVTVGDQASVRLNGKTLPGLAPVAMQEFDRQPRVAILREARRDQPDV